MRILSILFFQFQFFTALANTSFSVKIILPNSIELKNVDIFYNIGFKEISVPLDNYTTFIRDSSFSKYAVVTVSDKLNHFQQLFFVNSEDAEIIFKDTIAWSFVNSFWLKGATSIDDMGQKSLYFGAKNEIDERDAFVRKYVDFSIQNDSINKRSAFLEDKVRAKQYEFIKSNNKSYYSLWLFKYNFVNSGYYPSKELFAFYKSNLKKNFKGYFEAEQIEVILLSRINKMTGRVAPLFISKDYKGKLVDLNSFKGKFVILDFWAPWCAPCIAEMPVFNKIYQTNSRNTLEIISVNCDDDFNNFKKSIEKNDMGWINIFNDNVVINKYGKSRSLPQVYLIDKDGRIIYSRDEQQDYDLSILLKIISRIYQAKSTN